MGNPFTHVDLQTSDPAAAKKFYKAVFDWKFQEMPEMNWTGVDVGKGVGGGIGPIPPGNPMPPSWTSYVDVADVKKTMEKVEKAGGKALLPFMAIGDMGFIGVFQDPQGAVLGVWQGAKKPAPKRTAKKAAAKKPVAKKPAAKKPAAKKKKK